MIKTKLVSIALTFLLPLEVFAQCMQTPLTLQDRIQQSTLVVEATVVSQSSFWNIGQDFIYTSTTLNVHQVYKGTIIAQQIDVITEGGTIGNQKIIAEPSLALTPDETGLFCLVNVSAPDLPSSRVTSTTFEGYASAQSFIKYNLADQTSKGVF